MTSTATEQTKSKATKAQARACYDNYFGVLRCLNGGTREENERSAPACRTELDKYVAEAVKLASNPGKLLREDAWLMRALTEDIPNNFAAFCKRYPATDSQLNRGASNMTSKEAGTREDSRTGQFIPTVGGKDVSPTSFDERRALEIAQEVAGQRQAKEEGKGERGAEHTSGPWRYNAANRRIEYGEFVAGNGWNIAEVRSDYGEPLEANARLITAAPDLLEALRLADSLLEELAGRKVDEISAAIQKATGGAQ